MWLSGSELPGSPGHRFYEKLNELLSGATFDQHVEQMCAPYFEAEEERGRPPVAPGVYFRSCSVTRSRLTSGEGLRLGRNPFTTEVGRGVAPGTHS
jgi:hypothetical protein